MSTTTALPHWDMSTIYPGLESSEFEQAFAAALAGLDDLIAFFDQHHVDQQEAVPLDDSTLQTFEEAIERYSAVVERFDVLGAYIHAFITTDSRDTLAQARESELQQREVALSQLGTRLIGWIGSLDVEALIERSALAREHAFLLRKSRKQAAHLMSPAEEALAAELNVTGGSAWGKLYNRVASQILVPLEVDGEVREEPMSVVRNLAYDGDRAVRRRAYDAELKAWERAAVPLAGALNNVKGETGTLTRRRGWDSALDVSLFNDNIDRATLDAMMAAAEASFPDFRRYLHAKARALDLPALAWYDLFAPLGASTREWDFESATDFLLDQFGSYSDRLRNFAARAFRERWIDAEPRAGKRGGAFCMRVRGDESRILSNYLPSYDGMSTLAHELGHAYHNMNLAVRPRLLRTAPMTLAETASIFCETIVREAALQRADRSEQIAILESSVQGACQVVVDISSRFLFEQSVFEGRASRELSIDELNELMLDSQRRTYGDGLDQSALHPFMWASKVHYYNVYRPYYNYPYMFGLLFGLGLYARYRTDPEAFRAGYDELLSSTGLAGAAELAAGFGIDIRSIDFWNASLDVVRADINRLEALLREEQ